jgi:HD domain/GAF domain
MRLPLATDPSTMSGQGHLTRSIDVGERRVTDDLVGLGELAQNPSVGSALSAVSDLLGMEVCFSTRFRERHQVLEVLRGDGESFGLREGLVMRLEETYCQRVLAGRLPNLIPDVRADDRAACLPMTSAADVGAFASVPLTFSNGRPYGTLCAASHEPKPSFRYTDLKLLHVFARVVADQVEREEFERRTQALEETAREMELQAAAAVALVAAVRARDAYTGDHSWAVVDRAAAVAHRLELAEPEVTDVKQVALLHDIGKIAVPRTILAKNGPLTNQEWAIIRRHPIRSEAMIGDVRELSHLAPMVRAEHERWDGKGYADGLAGEAIPLASRITLVCDAYHAMTSDRPYRKALPRRRARAEISANLGTQFCPTAGAALLSVLDMEE